MDVSFYALTRSQTKPNTKSQKKPTKPIKKPSTPKPSKKTTQSKKPSTPKPSKKSTQPKPSKKTTQSRTPLEYPPQSARRVLVDDEDSDRTLSDDELAIPKNLSTSTKKPTKSRSARGLAERMPADDGYSDETVSDDEKTLPEYLSDSHFEDGRREGKDLVSMIPRRKRTDVQKTPIERLLNPQAIKRFAKKNGITSVSQGAVRVLRERGLDFILTVVERLYIFMFYGKKKLVTQAIIRHVLDDMKNQKVKVYKEWRRGRMILPVDDTTQYQKNSREFGKGARAAWESIELRRVDDDFFITTFQPFYDVVKDVISHITFDRYILRFTREALELFQATFEAFIHDVIVRAKFVMEELKKKTLNSKYLTIIHAVSGERQPIRDGPDQEAHFLGKYSRRFKPGLKNLRERP